MATRLKLVHCVHDKTQTLMIDLAFSLLLYLSSCSSTLLHVELIELLRLCLDLEKFGGRKIFGKVTFFPVFGLEKITKKKKYGEKMDGKFFRNKR